jgi:putative ABC transport system permease protein
VSTLSRKARADLRRRPVRTVLTIATLALAIASAGTLAVPRLMDQTMRREAREARLHDVAVTLHDDGELSPTQLDHLAHLPNVVAFEARVVYSTQATIGEQRSQVMVWGLDPAAQRVDAIQLTAGTLPRPGEILADAGNGSVADLPAGIGDRVTLRDHDGHPTTLTVSGTAHGLATSPSPVGPNDAAVFYAGADLVRGLSGQRGVISLAFRLADNRPDAQARTVAAVHDYLQAQTGAEPFVDLPDTRSSGDWPGRSTFGNVISLFNIITVLAVLCALFLIANTMNTLVAEQAGEIAILRTLGGRQRQISRTFLHTAGLLGASGAILGATLGIGVAYLLTRFFAHAIFDVDADFAVSLPVVVISLAAGPALAMAACLPALRRERRRPIAETLADRDVSSYGDSRLERLVARTHLLSAPARMGIRNALRQKRRSAATIAQVAVAVALAVALFAVARSVTIAVDGVYESLGYDIELEADAGAAAFDANARAVASDTPGVSRVEPVLENRVRYRGSNYAAYGLGRETLFRYELGAGRWFTATDDSASPPAVVLGPAVARTADAHIGQIMTIGTASGPTEVRVVGIDTGQVNNGGVLYFPLSVLQQLTGQPGITNTLWLTTTDPSPTTVDRTAADVRDRLALAGYAVDAQKLYVEQADNRAANDTLLTVIQIMGLLVVAIALIGLVSTLTMAVIERTREIGILRCLGARARHIRRAFQAEGVLLATMGWIIGVPVGWLLSRGLIVLIRDTIGMELTPAFPAISPPTALLATIVITVIVLRPTLRRATRIQPGTALRYE